MSAWLTWASDIFSSDNPLFLTRDLSKVSPISNVSTKPAEIGTLDTQTRTVYEPLTALAAKSPSEIEKMAIASVDVQGNIAPDNYYLTTQAKSSGILGNIWDIIKARTTDVINTGTNILLQQAEDYGKPAAINYNPAKTVAGTDYNPTYSKIMNYINQTKVKSEADTKSPNTVKTSFSGLEIGGLVIAGILLLFLILKRR